ncbi:MAG: SDR family NAD(P)-dependent oxidoreductase [Candidatus Bathyarchaeota archaeon]|nr:SDR family NAD(P)-dependent oxidoreductase [Candidatus Bathyarchaeota archaeon]
MSAAGVYLKVLVTGGAGFIGSHTVDRLLEEGFEVVVLDSLRSGSIENIHTHLSNKRFRFVKGDIRDAPSVTSLVKGVDGIVHLAALVSVPESTKNPALAQEINVTGTVNLLEAACNSRVKRFVYASSCAVYGEAEHQPVKETDPIKPISPYGLSKCEAEKHVNMCHEETGLETVCLRYFNVYGLRQAKSEYSGVITQFISRVRENLSPIIFGDGTQSRDFVHVYDVTEANLLALTCSEAVGEIFNVGTGVATSIRGLAEALLRSTGKTCLGIVYADRREGDIRHSVADISKIRMRLNYHPRVSLESGLRELVGCDV